MMGRAAAGLAPLVLPALSDDAPEVRDRAAALLDRLQADADLVLPRVQGLVTSGDAARQRTAARALAALADIAIASAASRSRG